jgi:aspartyl-tRNA(Asn)/glutamyl-tRNA(Gln) amidotransferase subunit B
MPGAMPVLNERAIEYTVRAGLSLGCDINLVSKWDRKNYFYPDLPKAWQTSQFDVPLAIGGKVDFLLNGREHTVRVNRIHLEEDAGKLLHEGEITKIDYNRCGVPLIEIVTEPDIHSPEEAVAFLDELRCIIKQSGVCDCKMQEGSLRVDVNLSVAKKGEPLGERTETKNLNSFRSVQRACAYEANRQIELLKSGKKVQRETRRWDDNRGEGECMRSKENMADYRFFPEPDLLPVTLSASYVEKIKSTVLLTRKARIEGYVSRYSLPYDDAFRLAGDQNLYTLFEKTLELFNAPRRVANVILGDVTKLSKVPGKEELEIKINPERLAECLLSVDKGEVSLSAFSAVLLPSVWDSEEAVSAIIDRLNIRLESNDGEAEKIVARVLGENEAALAEYRNGNEKVYSFFVGQAMKIAKGKISPKSINDALRTALKK